MIIRSLRDKKLSFFKVKKKTSVENVLKGFFFFFCFFKETTYLI